MTENESVESAKSKSIYEFAPSGKEVINQAVLAVNTGYGLTTIQPEQLLGALILEGSITPLLEEQGISSLDINSELISLIKPPPETVEKGFQIEFSTSLTTRSRNILDSARAMAMERKSGIEAVDIYGAICEARDGNHATAIINRLKQGQQ